jgi:hypothetical protein
MRISVAVILVALCLRAASAWAVASPAPPNSPSNCIVALPSSLATRGTEKSPLTVRVTQMPVRTADEIAQGKTEWREKVSTDKP